jgi:tetratricopeptide (TPR) repeat protein
LEPAGPDDLRQQVKQAQADLDLAEDLDKARLRAATPVEGRFEAAGAGSLYAESLYEETFAKAGLGAPGDDSEVAAARTRDSGVSAELVAALDDWASITPDRARRAWLLAVARRADPDPSRDRLRQPELWDDGPRLTKLVKNPPLGELSSQLTTALGRVLLTTGGDAVPLLRAAQARYPQDFWISLELGWALWASGRSDEALGFYRAALALRPGAVPAYNGVALTLAALGRRDEAIGYYRQALNIDPNFATAQINLGLTLHQMRRLDEAIDELQAAIQLDPNFALTHVSLARVLSEKGRQEDAIDQLQKAVRLDPNLAVAHNNLGVALWAKGRQEEAIGHFQQAVRLDPNDESDRDRLFITRYAAARTAVRASVAQSPLEKRFGEQEQVRLRRQALDWLRANLELRAGLLKDGKLASWSLSAWQTDPALAGVRDTAALAKLPDPERRQWQHLWEDLAALVAADPAEQGRQHAARADWTKAAGCFQRVLEHDAPDGVHLWFEYAAVLLLSGDRKGYEMACAHMVERCGMSPGLRAYHVARACTLAEGAVADGSQPGRLAETELKGAAGQFWSLTEQGALHYRAGRFQEAAALFEQSLRASAKPGQAVLNWLWLALAQQRLGKTEEARRWLDKASAWLDQYRDGMPARAEEESGLHLHNWLEAHVLRREADALIQTNSPQSGTADKECGLPGK